MTRAEHAAEKVRKEKEKLAQQEAEAKARRIELLHAVAVAESRAREEDRKLTNKRCFDVGALARDAGLFAWSNADLGAVFAVLSTLIDAPNPAGILLGALCCAEGSPGMAVAMATPVCDGLTPEVSA